jgi:hypothetical protein
MPGKRKAKMIDDTALRSMARAYTEKGIETLGGYVTSPEIHPDIKLRAIGMLLDRGWGRPAQNIKHGGEGSEDIQVTIRTILEGKK